MENLSLNNLHRFRLIFLTVVVLVSIWFGLGATRLWDRDEPRNARCAVEMLERNDWVVPMFNGQLRTHKPILLYWLQMPSIAFLGETDFAARFGSAAMASLAVLAIYLFGSKVGGTSFGFWSGAALATCLMFVVAARAATPDSCLIATGTIGILALARHWQTRECRFTRFAWLGYSCLGLAILAKGPVGLVLPMMVIGLWSFVQAWSEPSKKQVTDLSQKSFSGLSHFIGCIHITLRRLQVLRGLLLAIVIAAPWYTWVGLRTDGQWLYGFFFEHNLSRAVSAMEGHGGGWWFYPVAAMVGLFPWSMLMIPILAWSIRHSRYAEISPTVQLGTIWLSVYIIMFSFAQTKLPSYITPGYPGAALLIGGFLSHWRSERTALSLGWLMTGAGIFSVVGIAIGSGLYIACRNEVLPHVGLHGLWSLGFVAVGGAFAIVAIKGGQQGMPLGILTASLVFLAGMLGFAAPQVSSHRYDLNAVLNLKEEPIKNGEPSSARWCSVRAIEPSWVYYLRANITEWSLQGDLSDADFTDENSEAIQSITEMMQESSGRLIVDASKWRLGNNCSEIIFVLNWNSQQNSMASLNVIASSF